MSPLGYFPLRRMILSCFAPGFLVLVVLAIMWNNPGNVYMRHINAGNRYYEQHQFQNAVSEYSGALAVRPNGYNALLVRGMAYYNLHQFRKAIADDSSAITATSIPRILSDLYYNRALCYERLNDYARAAGDYSDALRENAYNRDALINRADAYRLTGNSDGAIVDVDTYVRRYPPTYFAYFIRGNAHMMQKQWKDAAADFANAVKIKNGEAQGWGELGWAQYMCEDIPNAIRSDLTALKLQPRNVVTLFNLALCYAAQQDWSRAEPEYKQAIEHATPGDLKSALEDVHNALNKDPRSTSLAAAELLLTSAQKQ